MNLSVVGTGYVGLVTAACFADLGHTVIAVDQDPKRIQLLGKGQAPFYEPGLEELLRRVNRSRRLTYSTDAGEAVRCSEVIFITVGTPGPSGASWGKVSEEMVMSRKAGPSSHW